MKTKNRAQSIKNREQLSSGHILYRNLTFLLFLLYGLTIKAQEKSTVQGNSQPIILWIVTEDISPTLSFYGDNTAKTPNLDALANESLIYDNAFAPVGVCAPTRSSIITGMYPASIGTAHMRTGKDVHSWGKRVYASADEVGRNDIDGNPIRQYSAVIPKDVKCFPEYLRANGYFCTNNEKTDYQFAAPVTAWNQNNKKAHWRNRPKNTPFFSVFNIGTTHESRFWVNDTLPLTIDPADVPVPPYLPDNGSTRKTIARHYSNVELMDAEVGEFIKQLKADGLYDNTIIFFYSDHGGPLPRQKREIYYSGLKVPFMIKDLNSSTKGHTDRLISFVDLAPTLLSLAGIQPPDYLQGKAFRGSFEAPEREYVFGSSDRFDGFTDRIRAVRNKRFLYLRNSYPDLPKYKDVAYRKQIPMMPVFLDLEKQGKLDADEKIWFGAKKGEELYDCKKDPHNMNNLADNPEFVAVLNELRKVFFDHVQYYPDLGALPESQLIDMMWPNFEQPVTATAKMSVKNGLVTLESKTEGASIAYYISDNPSQKLDLDSPWELYSEPFVSQKGKYVDTMAQRIGFKESGIGSQKIK